VGWRIAFVAVGLPGLLLALLGWLTVREPPRGQSEAPRTPDTGSASNANDGTGTTDATDAPPAATFREVVAYLWQRRAFVHLTLAASLYAGVAGTFNIWGIAFMQRVHAMSIGEAGLWFGLATGIPGVLGTLASGWLADRLAARDRRWWVWIPAIGGVAMLPFSVMFVFARDPQLGLWAYAAQVFLSTFWMAPGFAAAQCLAKLRMRATAAAIFLLAINAIGLVLLPAMVGAISDALSASHGSDGLRYALLVLACLNLWAVGHSLRMQRSLEADLAAASR
jgi:MFS family permease